VSFLYQISTQFAAQHKDQNVISLLQLNQHYRLSSQDNQLLLISAIAVADFSPVQLDVVIPSHEATSSTLPALRLFAKHLSWQLLQQVLQLVAHAGQFLSLRCLQPHPGLTAALELTLTSTLDTDSQQQLTVLAAQQGIELLYLPTRPQLSQPGLLVMDMDSTAIEIECIDEIATLAGVGAEVAKVTAQAMNGELDFAQSLIGRVATLKGTDSRILAQVLNDMPIMPGLAALVSHLQQHHWHIAIASGGFTYFTQALQQRFGLTATFANQLEIVEGKLTGKVLGAIVDAQTKAKVVQQLASDYQIAAQQTVAIGDGANDIPMLKTAHYGVAFHAKPAVQAQAKYTINQGSLLQLLYLFDS
jgi:phosphoserine phosphatase